MIETIDTGSAKVVGWKLRGTLHDQDYRQFLPQVESILTTQGKVRLFVYFEDFHGWDLHAAWDDFKFGVRHYSDFERIAIVGDRRWEKWMATLCKPFTRAEVKYFDHSEVEEAWKWLYEDHSDQAACGEDHAAEPADQPESWRSFPWYGF